MIKRAWGFGWALLTAGAALASAQAQNAPDLVVHEWGTFLAMQGSDGSSLDGMYHEEHALPSFVHARSRDQLRVQSAIVKGETPVIYFYTQRPQRVDVRVDFPRGVWTQWFPQARQVGPQFAAAGDPLQPRHGKITWVAHLFPITGKRPAGYPATDEDSLWNYARDVDATFVTTQDIGKGGLSETDRFLFYRGLGEVPLPLTMTHSQNGTLTWGRDTGGDAAHLFVLRVENGRGAFRYLPRLAPGQTVREVLPSLKTSRPLPEFTREIGGELAKRLTESGLYAKEARAMVNTWRTSYFHTDGVRVLFVLPRTWTDRTIPMRLRPEPRELVRVMVGRLELLTPERERRAEEAIRGLAEPQRRAKAFQFLRDQGRYVEPIVRRTLRTTRDEDVRKLCTQLLGTSLVTELRAAVHDARTGGRLADDPVHVRAQLASLLREMGLDAEAKREAEPVLAVLRKRPQPSLERSTARHSLRALARALEGAGDHAGAAAAYGRFLTFAAQVKTKEACRGCHVSAGGPTNMAWYRDWWAGRKYARYTGKSADLEAEIAALQRAAPGSAREAEAQLKLAFLYAAQGREAQAKAAWLRLQGGPAVAANR